MRQQNLNEEYKTDTLNTPVHNRRPKALKNRYASLHVDLGILNCRRINAMD